MCKYFTVSFSIQKEADPILGETKLAAANLVQGRDSQSQNLQLVAVQMYDCTDILGGCSCILQTSYC